MSTCHKIHRARARKYVLSQYPSSQNSKMRNCRTIYRIRARKCEPVAKSIEPEFENAKESSQSSEMRNPPNIQRGRAERHGTEHERFCPCYRSVGRLVGWPVGRSVGRSYFDFSQSKLRQKVAINMYFELRIRKAKAYT